MTSRLVAVAGTNLIKVEGTQRALGELVKKGYHEADLAVRGVKVPDCPYVPPQPFGLEQTRKGALYRAQTALDLEPEAQYGVGIESGILGLGDAELGGLDVPVVALVSCFGPGRVTYASGSGVPVEAKYLQASLLAGQQRTCGQFIADERGYDHADWQKRYLADLIDRKAIISLAVFMAFTLRFTGR